MEVTNGIPIPFTHMRKILALFLTLALLLAGIPAVYAQTADHADLTVEFTPTENQNGQVIYTEQRTTGRSYPQFHLCFGA